ncbi:UDP-glucuronate decarboxylase [Mycoplana sp. BE70]|uniref:UDP-glucuronic acid decarboxylase family protein n=1 Tax=Mycoplana sp. BE70 TaxID=2817775 RepID=UPI002865CCA6|nr:SDR family oxidoreductase [Mycoplana sp. BE70]MDR6757895.1 UDP-glucuronate decarboxylase [Mycoplana sp. BE70]
MAWRGLLDRAALDLERSALVSFKWIDQREVSEDRNILITGGAGFLGSHLAELLASRGNHVFCLDNIHTGRCENFANLEASARLTVVRHDIIDGIPDTLPAFSEIYNFACAASPVHYQADPVSTALVNSTGVWNVLRRAERDGARVFQASTSEVYGDPHVHPQREDYWGNVNSIGPRACYDEGKRFAETLCTDFARARGLTLRMARIFNTYGPRMRWDDGRVVSNFIVQALLGQPLTLYGDGTQTRSFCYVDDLVRGIDRLMQSPTAEGPVNLGNPVEFTIEELARLVLDITGSNSPIIRLPLPTDDPRRRRPDIGKATRLLDWQPETALRDGLVKSVEYFRGELGRHPAGINAAE